MITTAAEHPETSIRVGLFQVFWDGPRCSACSKRVGQSVDVIRRHLKTAHPDYAINLTQTYASLHRSVMEAMGELRQKEKSLSQEESIRLVCPVCTRHYGRSTTFWKHVRLSNGKCNAQPRKAVFVQGPSGRLFEKSSTVSNSPEPIDFAHQHIPRTRAAHPIGHLTEVNLSSPEKGPSGISTGTLPSPSIFRPAEHIVPLPDYESTRFKMSKYVREDEQSKIGTYISLFHPLLRNVVDVEGLLKTMVGWWNKPINNDSLERILESGDSWLRKAARLDVAQVPGDLRAGLLKFDGQDLGEVSQNITYNFRHKENILACDLRRLLCFVWRHDGPLLKDFHEQFDGTDPYFVPRLISALQNEKANTLQTLPMIQQYCLSRCFRVDKDGNITMAQAGDVASDASSVLSLMRAAVCSLICHSGLSMDFSSEIIRLQQQELVQRTRTSVVANLVSPLIRRLREVQRSKPKKRIVTTSPDGDISIDGFDFEHSTWKSLIPIVSNFGKDQLSELLVGDDWKSVLDLTNPIRVKRTKGGNFEFEVSGASGKVLKSTDFKISDNFNQLNYQKLHASIACSFHGLGLGSMRLSELWALTCNNALWHRGTVYFSSSSIKKFTINSVKGDDVTRKLPQCLSRLFLLFHLIVQRREIGKEVWALVPELKLANYTLQDLIQHIFNLESAPDATQIRHLWTSICNVIFPHNTFDCTLFAEDLVAEQSGHSAITHRKRYATALFDGIEEAYRRFHSSLGYRVESQERSNQLTISDLLSGLQTIFGPNSSFKSDLQRDMVEFASAFSDRHGHIGIPVGGGKSLSWTLPLVSARLAGVQMRTTIVVVPYKFLASTHFKAVQDTIQDCCELSIALLTLADINRYELPGCLRDQNFLPDLVFLTIDALDALFKFHGSLMKSYAENKLFRRFFIDEVHTVFTETFRDSYCVLFRLAALKVPIMTLSGTVPSDLLWCLLKRLNLTTSVDPQIARTECHIVRGGDIVGDFPQGFEINVTPVRDSDRLLSVSRAILSCLSHNQGKSVQVFVDTKSFGDALLEKLPQDVNAVCLNSNTTFKQQQSIAERWRNGSIGVLISTSLAVVGNENSKCASLVLCNFMFNLFNIPQIFGRLRPNQRISTGKIEIFVEDVSAEVLRQRYRNQDDQRYETLRSQCLLTDRLIFDRFLTSASVREWLLVTKGCRLKSLSNIYGIARDECGVCDRCRNRPISVLASVAATQSSEEKAIEQKARDVLQSLRIRCFLCSSIACDGLKCRGSCICYKCGGYHKAKECVISLSHAIGQKACYGCFELKKWGDWQQHDFRNCLYQRRINGLLHDSFRNFTSEKSDYTAFLRTVYSTKQKWFEFLSTYHVGTPETDVRQITNILPVKRYLSRPQNPYSKK